MVRVMKHCVRLQPHVKTETRKTVFHVTRRLMKQSQRKILLGCQVAQNTAHLRLSLSGKLIFPAAAAAYLLLNRTSHGLCFCPND